jgi:hypothetical protein
LCCLWFLGVLFFDSLRRLSQPNGAFASTIQLSAFVASLGFLTHGLADFNLHIPANAVVFFLFANLATSEIRQSTPQIPKSGNPRRRHRNH